MNVCYLYTPALRIDSVAARPPAMKPDVVVVDLEDSTHIRSKQQAREKVLAYDFSPIVAMGVEVGLRVNAISTFDGVSDLLLVRSLFLNPKSPIKYVFIPKARHAAEVAIYRSLFDTLSPKPLIYTFIETVDAVDEADEIARASDALCFGQADLLAELYSPNQTFLNYARARLCAAAAKYNIMAIDTNSFEIEDLQRFESECVAAKEYGFTGKAAIHPKQIPGIKRIFSIVDSDLQKWQGIVDAYAIADVGFTLHNGEAIAPPFVARSRRLLDFHKKHQ